jgi:osmotically-inducible protein OsmY
MTLTTRPNDTNLRRMVLDELRWDPRVQDTRITVAVENGVVSLTGAVYSYATRLAAQEAAHRVEGVHDVANDIVVEIPPGRGTDADIARAVRNMLEWDVRVPDTRITSTVSSGWVTLDGTVERWSEREDAERAVANVMGVQGVTNKIRVVHPDAKPGDLRRVIEDVLARRAERHAKRIEVTVSDGVVTLSGPVDSPEERRALVGAARLTPGVHAVDDHLRVESYKWIATPAE